MNKQAITSEQETAALELADKLYALAEAYDLNDEWAARILSDITDKVKQSTGLDMTDTEAAEEAEFSALVSAHSEEAESLGAEFYNFGWASGENFIHSKTDHGRLFTQRTADGTITHEWQR